MYYEDTKMEKTMYDTFIKIILKELIPAVGCTEPSSIAFAAAKARSVLGCIPEKVKITISGDILKNAKSAVVPNTGGLVGIKASVAAGIIAGAENMYLEVLIRVSDEQRNKINTYLKNTPIEVEISQSGCIFEIEIEIFSDNRSAKVRIANSHTRIMFIEKNGELLYERDKEYNFDVTKEEYEKLNIGNIIHFTEIVKLDEIREIILKQIMYNTAISDEGLKNECGANIGKTILQLYGKDDVRVRAKAKAAAGSDARMHGSTLPVIVVCGSGNQGITASVPVVEYAKEMKVSEEILLRAIILSDLVAIYIKSGIGKLSAFCGAVCAAIGAASGIAYMKGGREPEISHTIVNAIGVLSGMICDGAKASCAAKIAAAVDSAIFGYEMYISGNEFRCGDGIIASTADKTIENVGRLGSVGFKQADFEILQMMLQSE